MVAHWDDVASDLSALHRIDDPLSMPSRRLFALAYRLPAYQGVIALRVGWGAAAARMTAEVQRPAPPREISFDDWVSTHKEQVMDAAIRMGGGAPDG